MRKFLCILAVAFLAALPAAATTDHDDDDDDCKKSQKHYSVSFGASNSHGGHNGGKNGGKKNGDDDDDGDHHGDKDDDDDDGGHNGGGHNDGDDDDDGDHHGDKDDDDDDGGGHHGENDDDDDDGDDDDDDDGCKPEPTVCDHLKGPAFDLCIGFCEQLKCSNPQPNTPVKLCNKIRTLFERITGTAPPCAVVACPCPASLPLFAAFVDGSEPIEDCIITPTTVSVIAADDEFSFVESTVAAGTCSDNQEPPIVPLTDIEALTCRTLLIDTALGQGVICGPPE